MERTIHMNSPEEALALQSSLKGHKVAHTEEDAWNLQEFYKGKPHGWIQWKGTEVCMDLHCKCGESSHIDADFVYHVKCPYCKTVYMCNGHIELIELSYTPENCCYEAEA